MLRDRSGQIEQDAVIIDQAHRVAVADEGHRRAFDHHDAQLIGPQAHHGRPAHPLNLFQLRLTYRQRHAKNAAANIGSEDGERLGVGHHAIAADLNGFRRLQDEMTVVEQEGPDGQTERGDRTQSHDNNEGGQHTNPARVPTEPGSEARSSAPTYRDTPLRAQKRLICILAGGFFDYGLRNICCLRVDF